MRSQSTFVMLTLVCLSGICLGCAVETGIETATTEEGVAEAVAPVTPDDGPTIPSSMLPDVPGAGAVTNGEQPPVPNYPDVQPPATTPPSFDPNLPPAEGQRVIAEAGVGKKGQSLKDEKGIGAMIVQPARSLFAVEQRMVFQVQIPKAMQTFSAIEGRKPNSHDEYMSKIIKANLIKLPELPAGQSYIYDPKLGELMVQKK